MSDKPSMRERIKGTDMYKSGEEFTANKVAAVLLVSVEAIRKVMPWMIESGDVTVRHGFRGGAYYRACLGVPDVLKSRPLAGQVVDPEQAKQWHR